MRKLKVRRERAPTFEVVSNPTIKLSDLKRRFYRIKPEHWTTIIKRIIKEGQYKDD